MAIKDGGNPKAAAGMVSRARTSKAGAFDGGKPPPGPKPEPVRLNGVKAPKETGVSKK